MPVISSDFVTIDSVTMSIRIDRLDCYLNTASQIFRKCSSQIIPKCSSQIIPQVLQ